MRGNTSSGPTGGRRDRALRWLLARILPYPGRFRLALLGAKIGRPFAGLMPDAAAARRCWRWRRRRSRRRAAMDEPQVFPAEGERRMRVALMTGCAQRALNTDINEATIRLLTRHGVRGGDREGHGLLRGADPSHGQDEGGHAFAAKNIRAWMAEVRGAGLDAMVINTSGCGTTVKDYGHMFRTEALAADAATVAGLARTSPR
jgi:glycolate oxidase iron-sulfur subunit